MIGSTCARQRHHGRGCLGCKWGGPQYGPLLPLGGVRQYSVYEQQQRGQVKLRRAVRQWAYRSRICYSRSHKCAVLKSWLGLEPATSRRDSATNSSRCNCRSPSSASLPPLMSAPELPPELAGHLDVLTDSSDAHAKARAATANASGNAHVAALAWVCNACTSGPLGGAWGG